LEVWRATSGVTIDVLDSAELLGDTSCHAMWRQTEDSRCLSLSLSCRAGLGGLVLALAGIAMPVDVTVGCNRPKAAALYIYDFMSDSYVLQSVYDDGVDIGNSIPVDENGQPYELMDGVWQYHPGPGWDGGYPEIHPVGHEPGDKSSGTEPALASSGSGNCTILPPITTHGQRRDSSGVLRMHIVVRAPRHPAPGWEGVWFGEQAAVKGRDLPHQFCDEDDFVNAGTCQNGCGSKPAGVVCAFRLNHGQQTMVCQRRQTGPGTTRWFKLSCG
jgi:hypothetical protein